MWEGDIPIHCSGATIRIALCPLMLSLSSHLGSTEEELQQEQYSLGILASSKKDRRVLSAYHPLVSV